MGGSLSGRTGITSTSASDRHPTANAQKVSMNSVDRNVTSSYFCWGIGVKALTRGLATLSEGKKEPLMVKDNVEKTNVSLGEQVHGMLCFSLQSF